MWMIVVMWMCWMDVMWMKCVNFFCNGFGSDMWIGMVACGNNYMGNWLIMMDLWMEMIWKRKWDETGKFMMKRMWLDNAMQLLIVVELEWLNDNKINYVCWLNFEMRCCLIEHYYDLIVGWIVWLCWLGWIVLYFNEICVGKVILILVM